ncbi:unnamed protein product [Rotaria sp. Silwood2]|nr:unnamed protein product [Rotaria sp. Silwood2]CAF2823361.1 unnamed protein product [Rotaria sp. Silwood2]CAF3141953.1 unnamed protein product [Rotaria sp. Silwood2]CAF3275419.1 unnamed protein product [Rotaria sp. Silwood2]CAF4074602.1 unnamed protein product [Rotaria sp. Silwood2]
MMIYYVVKPGIRGTVDYLIDLLRRKCVEDIKLAKSLKHIQSSSSSSLIGTTVASSTTVKSISNVSSNNPSETSTIKNSYLSNDEHKKKHN